MDARVPVGESPFVEAQLHEGQAPSLVLVVEEGQPPLMPLATTHNHGTRTAKRRPFPGVAGIQAFGERGEPATFNDAHIGWQTRASEPFGAGGQGEAQHVLEPTIPVTAGSSAHGAAPVTRAVVTRPLTLGERGERVSAGFEALAARLPALAEAVQDASAREHPGWNRMRAPRHRRKGRALGTRHACPITRRLVGEDARPGAATRALGECPFERTKIESVVGDPAQPCLKID